MRFKWRQSIQSATGCVVLRNIDNDDRWLARLKVASTPGKIECVLHLTALNTQHLTCTCTCCRYRTELHTTSCVQVRDWAKIEAKEADMVNELGDRMHRANAKRLAWIPSGYLKCWPLVGLDIGQLGGRPTCKWPAHASVISPTRASVFASVSVHSFVVYVCVNCIWII